jgi:hypothetical protein
MLSVIAVMTVGDDILHKQFGADDSGPFMAEGCHAVVNAERARGAAQRTHE